MIAQHVEQECRLIEATQIVERLYQGSEPPIGPRVGRCFDILVLCAAEIQPRSASFPGIFAVIHAPLDDAQLSPVEWGMAQRAGAEVAKRVVAGARVLVTCQQGRNRSGLVMAVALRELTGMSGLDIVKFIRSRRQFKGHPSLTNESFVKKLVQEFPAARGHARRRR